MINGLILTLKSGLELADKTFFQLVQLIELLLVLGLLGAEIFAHSLVDSLYRFQIGVLIVF